MPTIVWTPKAENDLEEILHYIRVTAERPLTAERVGKEIVSAIEKQVTLAIPGPRHVAAPPEWRYFLYKRWLVFYRPQSEGIEVKRIIDGVRDLPCALPDLPE